MMASSASSSTSIGAVSSSSSSAAVPTSSNAAVDTSAAHSAVRPTSAMPCVGDLKVLDKRRLDELVKEVDPMEQLDEEVEELLLQVADDFIDSVATASCQLAKHRKANTLEVKDVQLHLERNWNMWIPGYGTTDESRPYKKSQTTEAHKQRMALIKKALKKF